MTLACKLAPEREEAELRVFVVHIYDAADRLSDYYVHQTVGAAVRGTAADVVAGRFEGLSPWDFEVELGRVIAGTCEESGGGRRHVRCGAWRGHIDELQGGP